MPLDFGGGDRLYHSAPPDYNGAYTVMMWAWNVGKQSGIGWRCPFSLRKDNSNYDCLELTDEGSGACWVLYSYNGGTGSGVYKPDGWAAGDLIPTTAGEWFHIALVRSSATSLVAYLWSENTHWPGQHEHSLTNTQSVTGRGNSGVHLTIGDWAYDGSDPWNEDVAAVKVWSRALTLAEIQRERFALRPVSADSLWGYYPLMGVSDAARDWSGGHTLTLSGTLALSTAVIPYPLGWGGVPIVAQEAGAGLHDLTAADLATGAPALGTPVLGIEGQLAPSDLATGAPALGSPSVGQVHALTANGLAAGAPSLAKPGLNVTIQESFEDATPANWDLTVTTSGTGTVTRSNAVTASEGSYTARCFTTETTDKAFVEDHDWTDTWSSSPDRYVWQRFRVYVPSATANALTGTEYLTLAGFWQSDGAAGWYLRLGASAALRFGGYSESTLQVREMYATLPLDQWVQIEMGLWTGPAPAIGRSFMVLVNGDAYGWFTYGAAQNGNDIYNRIGAGILETNSADDLTVYLDAWEEHTTGSYPNGTDNRPTTLPVTLDYRDQSGENVEYHYCTWSWYTPTLSATYGLTTTDRIQSGVNCDRIAPADLASNSVEIGIEWANGATPPWPPELEFSHYFAPMVAFHKSIRLETNLEVTCYYDAGDVTLIYESWTTGGTIYDSWQVPIDHTSGKRIPGRGDKIRARWRVTSATNLHVQADYYDASATTWYTNVLDDERDVTNINGVNFLDSDHIHVTNTIDSPAYTITYQSIAQIAQLTATGLAAGQPALAAPTLGQVHALECAGLTAGQPALGAASLAQAQALDALSLTTGPSLVGTATIRQQHALGGMALTAGQPAATAPTLGQTHVLLPAALSTGAALLEAPSAGTEGTDALAAAELRSGAPSLDAPSLGQLHAVVAVLLLGGTPVLGGPVLTGAVVLGAEGVASGAPVLDGPALTGYAALTAGDLASGALLADAPVVGQVHDLAAAGVLLGVPAFTLPLAVLLIGNLLGAAAAQDVLRYSAEAASTARYTVTATDTPRYTATASDAATAEEG